MSKIEELIKRLRNVDDPKEQDEIKIEIDIEEEKIAKQFTNDK